MLESATLSYATSPFFPLTKQSVPWDSEPLRTSLRELPWKPGRRTQAATGLSSLSLGEKRALRERPGARSRNYSPHTVPLEAAQSPGGGPGTPPALPVGAWGRRPPRGCGLAVRGSGSAVASSSSGLSEIKLSSGACSQPSFTCDPSELRLRQRALFPGPAEGMFYS